MKRKFYLLLWLLCSITVVNAQSTDIVIQKLVKEELIAPEEVPAYKQYVKQAAVYKNTQYLTALYYLKFKNKTGKAYTPQVNIHDFYDESLIEEEQIYEAGVASQQFFDKLHNAGIVSDSVFHKLYPDMSNMFPFSEGTYCIEMAIYETRKQHYWDTANLLTYAQTLNANGLVTKKYKALQDAIKNKEITKAFDFLSYFDKAVFINDIDFKNPPETFVQLLYQKTAALLPKELAYTNLTTDFWLDEMEFPLFGSNMYNGVCKATLNHNNKHYEHLANLYPYMDTEINATYYEYFRVMPTYLELFNKVLANDKSPYRLVSVHDNYGIGYQLAFGVVAIKQEQLPALQLRTGMQIDVYHNDYLQTDEEITQSYLKCLTDKQIRKAIQVYKESGILNHLNEEELVEGLKNVNQGYFTNYNEVLAVFNDVVFHEFGIINDQVDGLDLLLANYYSMAHGRFTPQVALVDQELTRENGYVTVEYNVDDMLLAFDVAYNMEYNDINFMSFINQVAKTDKLSGKYYRISGCFNENDPYRKDAGVIFLTDTQYHILTEEKLIEIEEVAEDK